MSRRPNAILAGAPRGRQGSARPNILLGPDLLSRDVKPRRGPRHAFTLTELLVVMGVIGTLAVLTLVATRKISQDAKLALGTNTVIAAINEARALAIKEHKDVMVAFFPRMDGPRSQVVEVIVAAWTGDTYRNETGFGELIDRFVPIAGAPVRTLPKGISVASPHYHRIFTDQDQTWRPVTYLPWVDPDTGEGELIGQPPGVMFADDGARILRNSHADSSRSWIDLNNDERVQRGPNDYLPEEVPTGTAEDFKQRFEGDETFISLSPILAVYDFDEALEHKTLEWGERGEPEENLQDELTGPDGYITQLGNRIHFNRYSGVVMR